MQRAKLQMPRHRAQNDFPLLKELNALSRAPSLRDPSTTNNWRRSPPLDAYPRRGSREQRAVQEAEDGASSPEQLHGGGWENKIVNWIDDGLPEGDRKQELLRSIDKVLTEKGEGGRRDNTSKKHAQRGFAEELYPHSRRQQQQQQQQQQPKQQPRQQVGTKANRNKRLTWRHDDDDIESEEEALEDYGRRHQQQHQLVLSRQQRQQRNDDYATDAWSDKEQLLKQHKGRRRTRRDRVDTGCANFRLALVPRERKLLADRPYQPIPSEEVDGAEISNGCGLPWYWSRQKSRGLLEASGRSLPRDMPRRACAGNEMVPATDMREEAYAVGSYGEYGRRHRSLTQKYRPKSFKEIIGQDMQIQALSNAVSKGRIAPVYLLYGPRGTGKSSAARILAMALNCAAIDVAKPCGVCRECLLFFLGKSPDVKEADFASHSLGSRVKKLLSDIMQPPADGHYKAVILDECDILTPEAWSTLLKCIEEPPEHAVFILITSEADKVPQTVTTRCQKFLFSKIKDRDIVARLQLLASNENLDVETDALELIAARSNGSLRDAETTLDQLSLVGQKITQTVVQKLVGVISNAKLAELLDMALSGDSLNTVKCLRQLIDAGVEPLVLMTQLATLITDILGGGYVPPLEKGFFDKNSSLSKEQLEKLRQALKTLSDSEKQIRSSTDQTTWLIAAVLQFAPLPSSPEFCHASEAGTSGSTSVMAANDEKDTLEWDPTQQQLVNSEVLDLKSHASSAGKPKDTSQCNNKAAELSAYEGDRMRLGRQQKLKETWLKVLEASQLSLMKHLLWNYARLLTISINEGRAVAYLEFQHPEHKSIAERSTASIAQAFQTVLGFPVEVRMALPGQGMAGYQEQACLEASEKQMLECGHFLHKQQPPQAEQHVNSRSFPASFAPRAKVDKLTKFNHDHDHPSMRVPQSIDAAMDKVCLGYAVYQNEDGRNELQPSTTTDPTGKRFRMKTVRHFAAVNHAEHGEKMGKRLIHSGLLCWKGNKVEGDDEESV